MMLGVRLGAIELAQVERLGAKLGETRSAVLRRLVRKARHLEPPRCAPKIRGKSRSASFRGPAELGAAVRKQAKIWKCSASEVLRRLIFSALKRVRFQSSWAGRAIAQTQRFVAWWSALEVFHVDLSRCR